MSNGLLWLTIYSAGVLVGLARVDGTLATRLGVALAWPVGVLAFAVTISALLVVAAIAFPLFGALVVVAALGAWWLM